MNGVMKGLKLLLMSSSLLIMTSCSKSDEEVSASANKLLAIKVSDRSPVGLLSLTPTDSVIVKVTTYNVLSKNHDSTFPNNTWAMRKTAFQSIIKQGNNVPEILGIQEGQNLSQVNDIVSLMGSGYDSYISPRTISARAIFWKNDKYQLVASDTKDILPDTTGYSSQRYASYVRLKHIATNKMLIIFNVHLPLGNDVHKQSLRRHMATYLAGKVQQYSSDYGNIPVIVMGDFNNYFDTIIGGIASAGATLTSFGLTDTYAECLPANRQNPDYRTKNDMENGVAELGASGSKRIDYIFTYPVNGVSVLDWRNIINFQTGSTINMQTPVPSDHNPVRSRLTLYWY
jgi:endonuclease/exonuclease/phosphatase family metal-dependent hydrolase